MLPYTSTTTMTCQEKRLKKPQFHTQNISVIRSFLAIATIFLVNTSIIYFVEASEARKSLDTNVCTHPQTEDIKYMQSGRSDLNTPSPKYAHMMSPAFVSLIAGSIAGAIGFGIAYPLDTLKTKKQLLALSSSDASKIGMTQLVKIIWKEEGLQGFFSGVSASMLGKAVIKAVAFSSNAAMLTFLHQHHAEAYLPNVLMLAVAACYSGFIASFAVTPFERVKIIMQASKSTVYKNGLDCVCALIKSESGGFFDLFFRGLGATIAREVPSYGIYFVMYSSLMSSSLSNMVTKSVAPLIFGAFSGCASWIPVYPIDVVKTLVQNTDGNMKLTIWGATKQLYQSGGIGAFFEGIAPKILLAALNHAVTFWVYDNIMAYYRFK